MNTETMNNINDKLLSQGKYRLKMLPLTTRLLDTFSDQPRTRYALQNQETNDISLACYDISMKDDCPVFLTIVYPNKYVEYRRFVDKYGNIYDDEYRYCFETLLDIDEPRHQKVEEIKQVLFNDINPNTPEGKQRMETCIAVVKYSLKEDAKQPENNKNGVITEDYLNYCKEVIGITNSKIIRCKKQHHVEEDNLTELLDTLQL